MALTTLEMIAELFKNKNKKFSRVGDERFIVYCDVYGYIKYKLNDIDRTLPVHNYQHEYWKEV